MAKKNKNKTKHNNNHRNAEDDEAKSNVQTNTVNSIIDKTSLNLKGRRFLMMDQSGDRLDAFIASSFGISRSRVARASKAGMVFVDNKSAKASTKPKPGAIISFQDAERPKLTVSPENHNLNILYEDDDLLVVDKVAGMAVHPAGGLVSGTLVNALLFHLDKPTIEIEVIEEENHPLHLDGGGGGIVGGKVEKEDDVDKEDDEEMFNNIAELKQGIVRPGIVHRLDRFTSGVMVVAKDPSVHAHLHNQFGAKTTDRTYEALVCGCPEVGKGTIRGKIGRDPKNRLRMAMVGQNGDNGAGKSATTNFEIIKSYPNSHVSHVKLVLETGRTHQIRVHCSSEEEVGGLGMPLLGDDMYMP